MPEIIANKKTVLKLKPAQSSQLSPGWKFNAPEGKKLRIVSLSQDVEKHGFCKFDPYLTIGGTEYTEMFVYLPDWDGWESIIGEKIAAVGQFTAAGDDRLILPITWRSQTDNSNQTGQGEGWRQCALTAVLMFLEAVYGLDWVKDFGKGWSQPEDRYASLLTQNGFDTTDPQAHEWLLNNHFGIPVVFRYDLSLQDAKETIDRALGLVTGVRWKAGGHYQYLAGKCLRRGGLYYKDPYGDRIITDTRAIDEYRTIGADGDNRYWPIPVVKDAWLDLGDRAGWGLWPKAGFYGFLYQKPKVDLDVVSAPATTTVDRLSKPQEFKVSEKAREIINSWEGYRSQQYYCDSGVSTIGWGSTRWFDGKPIPEGATCTEEEARKLQDRDLEGFMRDIRSAIDVPLNENQLAALLSWQYNTGAILSDPCGLRDAINQGQGNEAISHQFRRWCKDSDGVNQGLVNRRESEVALWMGKDWRKYR